MIVVLYSFVGLTVLFLAYLVAKLAGALVLALMVCTIPSLILMAGICGCVFYVRKRLLRRAMAARRQR